MHARWMEYLQQYTFIIKHKASALNKVAGFVRIRWRTLQKYGNKMKQLFQELHGELHDLVPLPKIPGYSIVVENFAEKIEAIQGDVRLKLEASNAKYRRTERKASQDQRSLQKSSPFQMGENDEGDNLEKDYYLENKESRKYHLFGRNSPVLAFVVIQTHYLRRHTFKETWQAYVYTVWRNELIPTTILTVQIESVTASSPGKSACWPIVDDLLLNGVKYPKVFVVLLLSSSFSL
ncbi:hypothetical protein Tco_0385448 [Tanacetum coccineum]